MARRAGRELTNGRWQPILRGQNCPRASTAGLIIGDQQAHFRKLLDRVRVSMAPNHSGNYHGGALLRRRNPRQPKRLVILS
jgi:hypothetical protein